MMCACRCWCGRGRGRGQLPVFRCTTSWLGGNAGRKGRGEGHLPAPRRPTLLPNRPSRPPQAALAFNSPLVPAPPLGGGGGTGAAAGTLAHLLQAPMLQARDGRAGVAPLCQGPPCPGPSQHPLPHAYMCNRHCPSTRTQRRQNPWIILQVVPAGPRPRPSSVVLHGGAAPAPAPAPGKNPQKPSKTLKNPAGRAGWAAAAAGVGAAGGGHDQACRGGARGGGQRAQRRTATGAGGWLGWHPLARPFACPSLAPLPSLVRAHCSRLARLLVCCMLVCWLLL
jgi:hypothetical protein